MIGRTSLWIALSILSVVPPGAAADSRQATITGRGGNGRCTVEVNVDGVAELDIFGDTGTLTTISGQPATWRRIECNTPLPRNPVDFRFLGTGGRGQATLVRQPAGNRGTATIRISDPQRGRGIYTFELAWREGGGWPPAAPAPLPGRGPWQGGSPIQTAVRSCQDSVTNRLNHDGCRSVTFEHTTPDSRPGGYDRITGSVTGRRVMETSWFGFTCSADFRSGTIRSVDVRGH